MTDEPDETEENQEWQYGRSCPTCGKPMQEFANGRIACAHCYTSFERWDGLLVPGSMGIQLPPGWDDEEDPE